MSMRLPLFCALLTSSAAYMPPSTGFSRTGSRQLLLTRVPVKLGCQAQRLVLTSPTMVAATITDEAIIVRGASAAVAVGTFVRMRTGLLPLLLALAMSFLAPVGAIEAILATAVLVLCGAAKYWPINFLAGALGAGALVGIMNAMLVWLGDRQARRPRKRRSRRKEQEGGAGLNGEATDSPLALITLVFGALLASVIGALP